MPDEFEKPSLLDAFGAQPDDPPIENLPVSAAAALPPQRHGAVRVEVKRDEREVLQNIKRLAASAGEEWYWRWPIKNKKTNRTDWKDGPTIKLANDVARLYGNDEIDTRVIDLGDAWLIMARFTDLETGFSMTRPFQQRKSQSSVGGDPERARDMALQIGVSKAIRNVVCNSLQSITEFAFEEAKNSLVGRISKELPKWRDDTIKKLEGKTELKRVEAVMGRTANEWTAPDVAEIRAMVKGVLDGMQTIDETFPPLRKPDEERPTEIERFADESDGEEGTPK